MPVIKFEDAYEEPIDNNNIIKAEDAYEEESVSSPNIIKAKDAYEPSFFDKAKKFFKDIKEAATPYKKPTIEVAPNKLIPYDEYQNLEATKKYYKEDLPKEKKAKEDEYKFLHTFDPQRALKDPQYKQQWEDRQKGIQDAAIETWKEFLDIPKIKNQVKAISKGDWETALKNTPDPAGLTELGSKLLSGVTGWDYFYKEAEKQGFKGKVHTPLAKFSGKVGRLVLLNSIGAAIITPHVADALKGLSQTGTTGNFLANYLTAGATYTTMFTGDEVINQTASYLNKEKDVTWANIGKSTKSIAEEAAFSTLKGGMNNLAKVAINGVDVKVPLSMITRATWDMMRAKRDNGQIDAKEIPDIILNAGVDGLMQYYGGVKVKDKIPNKDVVWKDLFAGLNDQDIDSVKKAGSVLIMQQMPDGFYSMEQDKQVQVLKDIGYGLASNKSLSDVMSSLDIPRLMDVKSTVNIQKTITNLSDGLQANIKSPEMSQGKEEMIKIGIETAEAVGLPKPTNPEEFKLYKEVGTLIHKYAERFGEKIIPVKGNMKNKVLGVFDTKTKNIFLKSVNDLSTAVHEVTHYMDKKYGFTVRMLSIDAEQATISNPDLRDKIGNIPDDLSRAYLQYYGGAQGKNPMDVQVREGLATFIQHYALYPERMKAEFPELVNQFVNPDGYFHEKEIGELIQDTRNIVGRYQQLDDLQKIGSRVLSDKREVVKDSFLNWQDKIITETLDDIYPIAKLSKLAGVSDTNSDPSLWARMYRNINSIILTNINSNKGFWSLNDKGEFSKKFDYNWKDLQKKLKDNDFPHFLVARREHFSYKQIDEFEETLAKSLVIKSEIENNLKNPEIIKNKKEFSTQKKLLKEIIKGGKALTIEKERLSKILEKDKFDRGIVDRAYKDHTERFKKEQEMFDNFINAELDLLNNPKVQLLDNATKQEFLKNEGYATFKRDVFNDIIGIPSDESPLTNWSGTRTKISVFYGRKGSELTIINPIYEQMKTDAEIFKKAANQIVYNKILEISNDFPELFQRDQLQVAIDQQGRISYPQEKNPDYIMARENYKRVPIMVDRKLKKVIDECLNYNNISIFEKVMKTSANIFTKGTTVLYTPFAFVNFLRDQITAAGNTKTAMKPIYDPIKILIKRLSGKDSLEARYFQEYLVLGGERQTLARWHDMTPLELNKVLNGEITGIKKAINWINKGLNILSFPVEQSELMTRGAEYVRARMKGEDQLVALEYAGEVTGSFHKKGRLGSGSFGKSLISSLPFTNASFQTLSTYGSRLNDPLSRKRALFTMAAVTTAMVGSAAYFASKASEEQKQNYKKLYPDELSRFIYFPHPDKKRLLRLAVPEQMATFGVITNMIIADTMFNTKYTAREYIDAATSWLPEQVNITDPVRMFFSWIPEIVMPIFGVAINKKLWPKVKDLENESVRRLPPRERAYASTSDFSRYLGKKLNLSPIKMDYLIEGYLGRTTRIFIGKNWSNPFIREMYFTSGRNIETFWEIKTQNDIDYKSVKDGRGNYTDDQKRMIGQWHIRLSAISNALTAYRNVEKLNENDERLIKLRRTILDGIDTLPGSLYDESIGSQESSSNIIKMEDAYD